MKNRLNKRFFHPDFPHVTPHIDEWCETCKVFQPNERETNLKHCLGCHKNLNKASFPNLLFPKSYTERKEERIPIVLKSRRCFDCYKKFYEGVEYRLVSKGIPFKAPAPTGQFAGVKR